MKGMWFQFMELFAGTSEPVFIRDDAEAIRSDWQAVGDDLRSALIEEEGKS